MKALEQYEVWLVAGSQEMYGAEVLRHVEEHAREIAVSLDTEETVPTRILQKGVATSSEAILALLREANAATTCIGVVAWMHTFSPAKMWIAGLAGLRKPLLHLHTQFNRDLPWSEIDMDFMNLNQSAHGDREFGFIETRLRLRRKTVVGHWRDPAVVARLAAWTRAACGWHEAQTLAVARFGDNMRQVAVTEGDKLEAQIRLGISVNGYGTGARRGGRGCCGGGRGRPRGDLRGEVRPRPGAPPGRRPPRIPATPPDRGWATRLPRRGRVRRVHRHLRGPRWPRSAAGNRRATPDGGRLRLRRRGRLEDGRCRPHREGHEQRPRWWDLLHGGLHLRLRTRGPAVLGAHMLEVCPRSPGKGPPARYTRSRSAARPIRCGSSSRPRPVRRCSWRCSISATVRDRRTGTLGSATSSTSCVGTRPTTGSPEGSRCSTPTSRNGCWSRTWHWAAPDSSSSTSERECGPPRGGRRCDQAERCSYGRLSSADLTVVDLATGAVVDGDMQPSSDTPDAPRLRCAWPDVGGIAQTRSAFATSWAQARPDPLFRDHACRHFESAVPATRALTTAGSGEYERETGKGMPWRKRWSRTRSRWRPSRRARTARPLLPASSGRSRRSCSGSTSRASTRLTPTTVGRREGAAVARSR